MSRVDRVRNEDVRLRLEQVGIVELAGRRQEKGYKQFGENERDDRITKKVVKESLKGRDLEESRGEDRLTILNRNLPLNYL